ncbi:DUF917 domain-containing protein [Actinoallomurus acanthiterrae]
MRELTGDDLRDLALGAAVLGTGGGGDPYIGRLLAERQLAAGRRIRVVTADELDADDLVVPTLMMGAPTVIVEKLPSGTENVTALRALEARLSRSAVATMPVECGGVNSMIPLYVGALLDLPVVDADGMGRAFPELQMETFHIYGVPGSPMVVADEKGDAALVETTDNRRMEWLARGVTIRMGGASYVSMYPMTAAQVRRTAIPGTLGVAQAIGRTLREAQAEHRDPFDALGELLAATIYRHGSVLFHGKVIDVERRTIEGFTRGAATLESFTGAERLEIVFQNEYLIARIDGEVRAMVPDLICTLDSETGRPVTTESLRYGMRITVYTISTPELMRTPAALETFGPAAFGLPDTYVPVEEIR